MNEDYVLLEEERKEIEMDDYFDDDPFKNFGESFEEDNEEVVSDTEEEQYD